MKPKPYATVHEMLAQEGKPPRALLPYDTYADDKAGFLTLAFRGEFISLPLLSLSKASLRGAALAIVLEFGTTLVQIDGKQMGDLFEDILLGKVRVIRTGKHPLCTVENIRISDVSLI